METLHTETLFAARMMFAALLAISPQIIMLAIAPTLIVVLVAILLVIDWRHSIDEEKRRRKDLQLKIKRRNRTGNWR